MNNFKIPIEILNALEKLQGAGFEAYLVGGCVRDLLMNREPKDWDITINAKPEQIQEIFPNSVYENNFGTVLAMFTDYRLQEMENKAVVGSQSSVTSVEITPFRKEARYSDKRHPDKVEFSGKLEDDLARRDFTINAMALQISNLKSQISKSQLKSQNYKIIDLFEGENDLKNKIIRTVGAPEDRFNEDALRIMRAVRFAAELRFELETGTEKAIKKYVSLLEFVSQERIRDELIKIIMSDEPAKTFSQMLELGVMKFILSELVEGWGVTQNKHHIFTVWEHNLRALTHAVSKSCSLDVRLASLFHDIGKPMSKRGEGPDSTFYGHEVVGAKIASQILRRLRFPKKFSEKVVKLVRWHLFFSDTEKITLSAVRRLVRNVGPENIWDLMKVRINDRVGMGRPKEEPYRLRKYEAMIEQALRDPISVKMLAIDGEDVKKIVNIPQSPKIGFLLNILLEEVLDDSELNTKEYLEKRLGELAKMTDEDLKELGKKAKKKAALEEGKKIDEIHARYYLTPRR